MATIDVRVSSDENITKILFADENEYLEGDALSLEIDRSDIRQGTVGIVYNEEYSVLMLRDKEHALNLIKALNKAIELGWLT